MESTIERELPDNQAGFKRHRGTRDHIASTNNLYLTDYLNYNNGE
jgi:hypothetical protein